MHTNVCVKMTIFGCLKVGYLYDQCPDSPHLTAFGIGRPKFGLKIIVCKYAFWTVINCYDVIQVPECHKGTWNLYGADKEKV